jgi:hypothetical protein
VFETNQIILIAGNDTVGTVFRRRPDNFSSDLVPICHVAIQDKQIFIRHPGSRETGKTHQEMLGRRVQ